MSMPFYVGFSRSGSHWIRLVLEEYMNGESPLSKFLECKDDVKKQIDRSDEFKGTHDLNLDFQADYVLYLYRNPIDCIFSNLKYDGLDYMNDTESINKYLNLWVLHITKWIYDEDFTKHKVIISYENLKSDFVSEFSKVLKFLKVEIDAERIIQAKEIYTKSKIREIVHDKKVINNEEDYEQQRNEFIKKYGKYIYNKLPESHKSICEFPLNI